jgi:predicted transcriptional regulator
MHVWKGRHKKRNKILVLKQFGMRLLKHGMCENNIKILGGIITIKMQDRVIIISLLWENLIILVQVTERLPN